MLGVKQMRRQYSDFECAPSRLPLTGTKLRSYPEPGGSMACGQQGCRTSASPLPVPHKNTNTHSKTLKLSLLSLYQEMRDINKFMS